MIIKATQEELSAFMRIGGSAEGRHLRDYVKKLHEAYKDASIRGDDKGKRIEYGDKAAVLGDLILTFQNAGNTVQQMRAAEKPSGV